MNFLKYFLKADSGQREQATDDETDLIEAIGEFDLQAGGDIESSYNSSSQNSLALN